MSRTTLEVEKSTLGNIRQLCRKDQTYDQFLNRRITCNATGCDAFGNIEVKVNAGKFGTVTLYVCGKCVGKFSD